MKVALDKRALEGSHKLRGVGFYSKELALALINEAKKTKNIDINLVDFSKSNLKYFDIVHYLDFNPFFLTLPFKFPTRTVVTIHDLIPLIYPNHYIPGIRGKIKYFFQKLNIKKVNAIITVSETSKKDIVRFLGIPADKVCVIYLAPGTIFQPEKDTKKLREVARKYNLPIKFVLYLGDINYNKNIPNLIRACSIAKYPLVIVGKHALEIEDKLKAPEVMGVQDFIRKTSKKDHPEIEHLKEVLELIKLHNVMRLGYLSDEDLVSIFNLATCYCQPSYYEGFGLPMAQALACQTPVVASKTQALVEIFEGCAIFAEPGKPQDLAEKIKLVCENFSLRASLIKEGNNKMQKFDWNKVAKETIDVYMEVLRNK
ncbi:hypothetical protein A2159_03045 [Candidatus Woesebacteria bacterium RBG_13_34_9]|uniref:Glycosyl transferase family 1 domain-containing protein n=1 Tax=Candidatus Woesebacteria bacterium RBG_13_34_9 TaxID=1802477 RepID=A0A1F7X0R1_9BACT|nr:MAG: hypothetical protein A2159_03045 [Candidatus Woesebacteria bacterium RBG_13_34_9]